MAGSTASRRGWPHARPRPTRLDPRRRDASAGWTPTGPRGRLGAGQPRPPSPRFGSGHDPGDGSHPGGWGPVPTAVGPARLRQPQRLSPAVRPTDDAGSGLPAPCAPKPPLVAPRRTPPPSRAAPVPAGSVWATRPSESLAVDRGTPHTTLDRGGNTQRNGHRAVDRRQRLRTRARTKARPSRITGARGPAAACG